MGSVGRGGVWCLVVVVLVTLGSGSGFVRALPIYPTCKIVNPPGFDSSGNPTFFPGVLDLNPLSKSSSSFSTQGTISGQTYKFDVSICGSFSSPTGCSTHAGETTSVLQGNPTTNQCWNCGLYNKNSTISLIDPFDPVGGVLLKYFEGNPYHHIPGDRESEIKIFCKPRWNPQAQPVLVFVDEDLDQGLYRFSIENGIDCSDFYFPRPSSSSGLSGGWIFVIIYFVLIFVYVTGGVVFNMCIQKTSGLDACPNATFWRTFWSNVLAGFQFVFCCRLPDSETSYNSVTENSSAPVEEPYGNI